MTVGIPGAGIGGLFYLLSALWMPFCESWRILRGRSSRESRRAAGRQVCIALAIVLSMTATAWLVTRLLTIGQLVRAIQGNSTNDLQSLPRFLSYSALAVSLITLVTILASVSLLRLVVRPRRSSQMMILIFALLIRPPFLHSAQSVDNSSLQHHLQQADAAFEDEDSVTAEREYRAVIAIDATNSRATFRLAQLCQKKDRSESERLFRAYIKLEPGDVWGYLALADFLGRDGRYAEALKLSSEALRRAPQERDAVMVHARLLGRSDRIDPAIDTYERWLRVHPKDAEALRELARQYRRAGRIRSAAMALERAGDDRLDDGTAEQLESLYRVTAPAIEPLFGFSRDSDGNTKMRAVMSTDFAVGQNGRAKLTAGSTQISDAAERRRTTDFMLTSRWRPRAAVDIEAGAGAVKVSSEVIPTTSVRARFGSVADIARLDLRLNRNLMDATPALLANRVVRTEVQIRPDFALSRHFRMRGLGGAAIIDGGGERNRRHMIGAGSVWKPAHVLELSANLMQSRYQHVSHVGYFAPQQLQSADAGAYIELDGEDVLLAMDLGGGLERFREHGAGFGSWAPAFRAYALVSFRLQPGREFRFEVDSYNTQAGVALAPTPGWKSASISGSLRWALR